MSDTKPPEPVKKEPKDWHPQQAKLLKSWAEIASSYRWMHNQAYMIYKKKNVTASKHFSKLVKDIAIEKHCAFWDWYTIAGGSQTMKLWIANQLAMKDGIHLKAKGSEIKAELLVNALNNMVYSTSNRTNTFENLIDVIDKK
jgi:lysophospholipase L1-like esterase